MTTVGTALPAAQTTRRAWGPALPRAIAGLVILVLWQVTVRAFAPDFVATPTGIAEAIPRVVSSAAFLGAVGITLAATAEGLVVALIVGTIIGVLMGRSVAVDRAIRLWINCFNAMPMLLILPLVSLWFGYSSLARFATIVFAAIFAVIINAAEGAKSVPREYVEVGRSFRSSGLRALFEIVLPASTPLLLAGLRLAAGRAIIGAVVAEFFTAIPGVGYFILYNSRTYHHNEAFVAVIFLAGFGVGFDALVNWATHRYLPWYRRDEQTE
ncbi:MAG TPA: ABC transporter permease [Alphaproteobacteria bacterium]|nr:ABC transporter permease [Alphaproteobacteria bacterium]